MQVKKIKVGAWYDTNLGVGQCTRVGGTFPPSVAINIMLPFPRGVLNFVPRDVKAEVDAPVAVAVGANK